MVLRLRAHLARFKLLIWEEKHLVDKGGSVPGSLNGERCFLSPKHPEPISQQISDKL